MTDQTHEFETTETEIRLKAHAALAGVAAPKLLLSDDGAPSKEVMAYCDTHQITLDWVYLGAEPMSRQMKNVAMAAHSEEPYTPKPAAIYKSDAGGLDVYGRIGRLYSLARVGIAASDSHMNIDLERSGYQGLFEQMSLIADELFEDIEILERAAKKEQFHAA